MDYQHTQTGRLMIFVSLAIVLLFSSILLKTKINTFVFVEMFVILGILALRDGKTYRIGTDEPENLEYAIMQAIKEFNKNK